jgi:hypothetical protein
VAFTNSLYSFSSVHHYAGLCKSVASCSGKTKEFAPNNSFLSGVFVLVHNKVFCFCVVVSLLFLRKLKVIQYNKGAAVFQSYSSPASLTPDDDVFKHLALTYSTNHETMHRGEPCKPNTPSFNQGITNGAAWYPLTG